MLFPVLALWLFHICLYSSTPEQIKITHFYQAFYFTLKMEKKKKCNFTFHLLMGLLCGAGKIINSATAVTFGKKVGFLLVVPVLSTCCVYISILAQIRTVVQE